MNDLVVGEKEKEEELSVEEKGRRIASQWTHDPEASGHAQVMSVYQGISVSGERNVVYLLLPSDLNTLIPAWYPFGKAAELPPTERKQLSHGGSHTATEIPS